MRLVSWLLETQARSGLGSTSTASPTTVRIGLSVVDRAVRRSPSESEFWSANARVTTISPTACTQRPRITAMRSSDPPALSRPKTESAVWLLNDELTLRCLAPFSKGTLATTHGPPAEVIPGTDAVAATWSLVTARPSKTTTRWGPTSSENARSYGLLDCVSNVP